MANRRGKSGSSDRSFLGLQNHCSHKIKMLASWKESYYKPRQCIKKQRHHFADKGPYSQLSTKVAIVKAVVFPVVMYRCESWILKKAEHQRIDAFKLWCWKRLLRVPWIARSNQTILKEINPEYSLEGMI